MNLRSSLLPAVLALPLATTPVIGHTGVAVTVEDTAAWLSWRWVHSDLAAIAGAARAWRQEKGAWPSDCAEAARARLSPAPLTDPWGSPYGCRVAEGRLLVFSTGPDGGLGTPDDITLDADSLEAKTSSASAAAPAEPPAPLPLPAASAEEQATALTIERIAAALESFKKEQGHYPVTDKVEHLERWLVSAHMAAAWSAHDGWARLLRYRTTDIGSSYTLASAGADGRWEVLSEAPASAQAGADMAVADGKPLRWPASLTVTPPPATATSAPQRDPLDVTRRRLDALAAEVASRRNGGKYPESDDAARLARDYGVPSAAADGWGRPLYYLSADAGRHFALVSAGPDGRLGRDMEAYARGAGAAGDDVIAAR